MIKKFNFLFSAILIVTQYCMAQNVGIGNINPQARLDIAGDVIFRDEVLNVSNGLTYALNVNNPKSSHYRISGPTENFIVAGITAGAADRMITLNNRSGYKMTILNNFGLGGIAIDKIITGTGNSLIVYDGGSVSLTYSTNTNRWEVINSHETNLNVMESNTNQLEKITEGGKTGWRLLGKLPDNYGDIGDKAVDFSDNNAASTLSGATGENAFAAGKSTIASGLVATAFGHGCEAKGDHSTAMGFYTTANGILSTAMGSLSSTDNHLASFVINGSSNASYSNITKSTADYQMMMNFDEYIFWCNTPGKYVKFWNDGGISLSGGICAQGSVQANQVNCFSDIRLKKDIRRIKSSLKNLLEIKPVNYYMKTDVNNHSLQTGVIAQEIEKIYPELVNKNNEGILSVNYIGLIPHLIKSIQEQQNQIEDLKVMVKELLKKENK